MTVYVMRDCRLLIDNTRQSKVLALWRAGQSCTFSIAQALDLPEDEVCRIIHDAEAAPPEIARQA